MRTTFKKASIFKARNKYNSETDTLIISREVSEKIDTILGSRVPECGGFMLGPKDADGHYIDEFIYDIKYLPKEDIKYAIIEQYFNDD